MRNTLIILLILVHGGLLAQFASPQLISTGGHFQQGSSISLSYSIGELAVSTLDAGAYTLTQGFQQPGGEVTFVKTAMEADRMIRTWPNPVADVLYIQINAEVNADLLIETYDLLGRLYRIDKLELPIQKDPYSMDVSQMESGLYILKIRSEDQGIEVHFRIRKD